MSKIDNPYSLIHVLPQSKDMKIKSTQEALTILDITEKILQASNEALWAFKSRKHQHFDPLVGENSCQIRAYMLYCIFQEKTGYYQFSNPEQTQEDINLLLIRIKLLQEKIQNTRTDFSDTTFSDKTRHNLEDFLSRNKLNMSFPKEFALLTMIFFLTRYTIINEEGVHTGIDYSKMHNDLQFSKTLSRRLIHLYQLVVSKESCRFIRLLANDLHTLYPEYEWITNLLMFTDDDGREVISCYLAMDILLKHMALNNTPIIIQHVIPEKNTDECRFFNTGYQLKQHGSQLVINQKNTACIVFRGISAETNSLSMIEKLSHLNIQTALLASTAIHPQYPGRKLESFKDNPFSELLLKSLTLKEKYYLNKIQKEFLETKKWALENGCCQESPATFFVTHIFCDNFSNYINTNYNDNIAYIDQMV